MAQTASRWGIVGVWRIDCSAPASRSNDEESFVIRDGKLSLDQPNASNPVIGASVDDGGQLDLRISFPAFNNIRQNVFAKTQDGRVHVVLNRKIDTDEYTIRNGKYVSNGRPTVTLEHDRQRWNHTAA